MREHSTRRSARVYGLGRRLLKPFCLLALAVSSLVGSVAAAAPVCATPGKDGVGTGLSGVINTYYAGSGTASGTTVTLGALSSGGATTAIAAGDLILIMQMQDGSATDFSTTASAYGTGTGNAGLYEYATVKSVTGSTLTLTSALTNVYTQNFTNRQTFQVVRVPQYSSATVTGTLKAQNWTIDASGNATGGILAMDVAGALTLSANLDVSGQGFRGGAGVNVSGNRTGGSYTDLRYPASTNNGASKGEGTAGTPSAVFVGSTTFASYTSNYTNGDFGQGAPGNAGGGANDGTPDGGTNSYNAGGGGGGNAGAGGVGGLSWSNQNAAGGLGGKATAFGASRLFMGGGGGAGGTNNNTTTNGVTTYPPASDGSGATGPITASGATGGGIIMVTTGTLSGGGQLSANGNRAYNMNGGSEAAGAGGGGGSVYLTTSGGAASPTINVNGGAGGNSNYYHHGPGGGGGGGYVVTSSNLTPTVNKSGGAAGLDSTTGAAAGYVINADGAAKGADGTAATTAAPSGTACSPNLTVTKTTSTPTVTRSSVNDSSTATYTVSVSNSGTAGGAVGVSITDPLPTPFAYNAAAVTPVYSGGASGPASITGSGTTTVTFGTAGGTNTNSFSIPQGGSVSLTFTVNLGTASLGTYQNPASVNFSDPTRTAAQTVSPGGTYVGGGTVGGSNYASASSAGEDVTVNLSFALPCTTVLGVANVRNTTTNAITGTLFQVNADGSLTSLANLAASSYALGRSSRTGLVYYFDNASTSTAILRYYDLVAGTSGTAATVTGTGGGAGVTTVFTRMGFRQDGTGYAMLGNGTLYTVVPSATGTTATVTQVTTGPIQDQDGNSLGTLGGGDLAFDKYDNAWAVFTDLDTASVTYNQSVLYKIDPAKLAGGNLKIATRIGAVTLSGAKTNLALNGLAFNADNNSFLSDNNSYTYSNSIGKNDASNQKSVSATVAGSTTTVYDLASCFYPDVKPAITVTKSVASAATPVVQGTRLDYTITVHNGGNAPATDARLTDAIPANTSYVAGSTTLNGTAVADSGAPSTMPFAAGAPVRSPDAAVGAPTYPGAITSVDTGTARDAVVKFSVTVNSGLTSSASPISNTATATYDNYQSGGADLSQGSNTTKTNVLFPPSVTLNKFVRNIGTTLNPGTQSTAAFGTSATGKPGEYLEYCIAYTNTGTGDATNLVLNDTVVASGPAQVDGYGTGLGILFASGATLTSGATAAPSGTTRTSTAGDTDGGSLTTTNLSVTVGTVVATTGKGVVCFKAKVP